MHIKEQTFLPYNNNEDSEKYLYILIEDELAVNSRLDHTISIPYVGYKPWKCIAALKNCVEIYGGNIDEVIKPNERDAIEEKDGIFSSESCRRWINVGVDVNASIFFNILKISNDQPVGTSLLLYLLGNRDTGHWEILEVMNAKEMISDHDKDNHASVCSHTIRSTNFYRHIA